MKLYYWSETIRIKNFGDELNPIIWKHYLPEVFDDNPDEMFFGIGTILNHRIPKAKKSIIMGSGVGYGDLPHTNDIESWKIYCLRGKLSAKALGVSKELVATDPAILVHHLFKGDEQKTHDFAFMPHWTNMGSSWKVVCDRIGIRLIDPLDSIDKIICAMKQSRVIIAQAMHGVIVADSLRIPWIPVHSSFSHYSPFKWQDWCSSLNLPYESFHLNKPWHPEEMSTIRPKHVIKKILKPIQSWEVEKKLLEIMKNAAPTLSTDVEFLSAEQKVVEAIDSFKRDLVTSTLES